MILAVSEAVKGRYDDYYCSNWVILAMQYLFALYNFAERSFVCKMYSYKFA